MEDGPIVDELEEGGVMGKGATLIAVLSLEDKVKNKLMAKSYKKD